MSRKSQQAGAILPATGGASDILKRGRYEWHETTENGIIFRNGTPEEYWLQKTQAALAMFESSRDLHVHAMFAVGDCLAFGEKAYGETYSQAIDSARKAIRLSAKTLANVQWICGSIKPELRRPDFLTLAHHEVVAKLGPEDQDFFLKKAEEEELTVAALRSAVKEKFPPPPRTSNKGNKVIVDLESEQGIAHALEKVVEFLENLTSGENANAVCDWSKERVNAFCPSFERLSAILCQAEPGALGALKGVAMFLDDPDNQPLKNWSDERKENWKEPLNASAKAGRRMGVIGGAK